MTGTQKIDAEDKKLGMAIKANFECFRCGRHMTYNRIELAHRIPKHKKYLYKYGEEIIHHELNIKVSCHDCNSYALLDPATHPVEAAELIAKIKEAINDRN